jgi:competence protein ComEA
LVFIIGLVYKTFFINHALAEYKNFDYTSQEKLFQQSGNQIPNDTASAGHKNIDYKQEVLDFNKDRFIKKEFPAKKSININTAGIGDLIKLPGIGKQTAEKIIQLRNKKGSFKKLSELLEVKGIGSIKLNKIESYIFIDRFNYPDTPER